MAGGKPFRFKLPLKNAAGGIPDLSMVQNDTNELTVQLIENGKPFSLVGATLATYTVQKPDGTIVVGNATILDSNDGIVSFTLDAQCVAIMGTAKITVEIYSGAARMTSAVFYFEITEDLAQSGDPSSESSYPILQVLVTNVSALSASITNAEGIRVTTENARKSAETARAYAETQRVINENIRIQYENERKVYETYNPLKTYVYGNKVNYQGSSYYCIATSQGIAPNLIPGRWTLMAEKGDKGEAANAVVTPIDGLYGLSINDAGHLILTYGTEAPAFELNSEGHLLVTI